MIAAIGQDSHRFLPDGEGECLLGGVRFPGTPGLEANSDGDVLLHAVTNAVSGITGRNILGPVADRMCASGITDSREYLYEALADLDRAGLRPVHLSVSIECARPKIMPKLEEMKQSLAGILGMETGSIGITATTGEGLTDFGRGRGISVFCILTAGPAAEGRGLRRNYGQE